MKRDKTARSVCWMTGVMLACALVAAEGCTQAGMDPSSPPIAQTGTATIALCNQTPAGCAAGNTFSLNAVRDLAINVAWTNVSPGTHTQTLELLEPGGGLYQATTQAFAIGEGASGDVTTKETVPVAGTWITQRRQMGKWTVRVTLDTQANFSETVELTP